MTTTPVSDTSTSLLDRLGEPLPTVLRAALDIIAVADPTAPAAGAVNDVSRLRSLIDVLSAAAPLRTLTSARCPAETLSGECSTVAQQLLNPDPDLAAAAAEAVHELIGDAVSAAKSERRQMRRETRQPAAERAASRADDELSRVRSQRNQARNRAEHFEREAKTLRDQLTENAEALAEAEERTAAARQQLTRLRGRLTEVPYLSGLLLEALDTSTAQAGHPAGTREEDPFEVLDLLEAADQPDGAAATPTPLPTTEPEVGLLRRTLRRALRTLTSPPPALTKDRSLRVEVLGAGDEIGGSCVLVEAAGTRVLIDCGMRPGGTTIERARPRHYTRALEGNIDAVVLTHAHNDHAGWVPALLKERPDTPVYATPATCDLLVTMWGDSARVMARTGLNAFTQHDVRNAIAAFQETPFGQSLRIGNLDVELFRAGHIVGAASVVITAGKERVVISGDVSAAGQETVAGFSPSAAALGADLLLLESTYAGTDRRPTPRGNVVKDFLRTITETVDRGGIALVPAFALGRAQEVALLCGKHLPDVPVLIDGLARSVTEVYERHPGPDGSKRDIFSPTIQRVPPGGTERAASTFRGGVVITTSGMLNQGPAVRWAERVLPDPTSALMVVGYQDEESPGAKLLRLAEAHGGTFELPAREGEEPLSVEVNAQVAKYQLGAHANADELATIVTQLQARQLMLVHGEPKSQSQFSARMSARAQTTVRSGSWSSA